MLKKTLFAYLLLTGFISFSQEMVKEFNLKLEKKRDFFQVVNEPKKEVIIFLNDKERVTSVRFDDKFNIIDSLSVARPDKTYDEILGCSQNGENYLVFWGSDDRKKISSQFFNFTKKETGITTFELELKKEKIIKEITINNTFYLITILKNTGILKFYTFENSGNLITKTVDLSNLQFKNKLTNPVNFYNAITEESSSFFFQNISNDSPPSLALSSKKFKIYTYKNDEIIFTIDNNPYFTDVLRINLTDFSPSLKSIEKPKSARVEYESIEFKSNSFLIDDKILQIKTNSDVLLFSISDLNGTAIAKFKALRDEEIPFKNTDVFQETNGFKNKKVLEKPKQFIRKINNSNPSISCYKLNGLYYTVIGSSQDIMRGGAPGMGMGMSSGFGGGIGGGFGAPSIYFGFTSSYTLQNLISYKDKNVVYTTCLFDLNFNHLEDKIKTSAFEKARIFLEESQEITAKPVVFSHDLYTDLIVFKFESSLYLGNYNKEKKKYQIFSFTE